MVVWLLAYGVSPLSVEKPDATVSDFGVGALLCGRGPAAPTGEVCRV